MKTHVSVMTLVLGLGTLPAAAQLHLITGSPNPWAPSGYVSALFRVTSDGVVEKVADLVTDSGGTEWIAASQDLRKAVLAPKKSEPPLVVVDFDKSAVVKRCNNPPDPDNGPITRWLLDLPDKGPVYAELLSSGDKIRIRAMVLDPSIPCGQSFTPINPADAKYLVASGTAGVAESGGYDWMQAGIEKDGTISRFFPHGKAYFDYKVPLAMYSDLLQTFAFVIANNQRLFAVGLTDYSRPGSQRLLILRKSDETWHRMPDVGENTDSLRAFGDFVAAVAAIPKGPTMRESAGRPEWRKEDSAIGPSLSGLFHESRFAFPGRLYLYDVSTGRVYSVATNQGDSEILLVEDGVVYYRASDRLYSTTMTDKGLGPSRLLTTSEVVRDTHWAFIKHDTAAHK